MIPVLIAGIGNLFKGDDGFGSAVAQELAGRALPAGVRVEDFGIRGLDLVYALLDGCRAAILIDSLPRGAAPGTLFVVEPETPPDRDEPPVLSPHAMDPVAVLRLARALGARCERILLVGCEPENLDDEMDLTPAVAASVGPAADAVAQLARELLSEFAGSEVT